MMIHLQKPQHLTTTFGISHDSLVFEIMNKLSVENNESYRSERHATGFFFTLSIAKDNVLEMRVP